MSITLRVAACALLGALFLVPGLATAQADDVIVTFKRADIDADGDVDISDALDMFDYIFFAADTADCEDSFDVDDSGSLDIIDVIYQLQYIFVDGPDPRRPFENCEPDPTDTDSLGCDEYTSCEPIVINYWDHELITHVLKRVTYGPTPDLTDHVADVGVDSYIAAQLSPEDIDEDDNDALNDILDELSPTTDLFDYFRWQFTNGLHSERQLQEVLTDFWDNHFNTNFQTTFPYFLFLFIPFEFVYDFDEAIEQALTFDFKENTAFRDNALGNFHDLLLASATSVTMLIYLDNISNVEGAPNENYAREILELHTMGVDNGYTQLDIEELAKVFTGWGICVVPEGEDGDPETECEELTTDPAGDGNVWAFHFFDDRHDDSEKTIFAGTSYEITLGDDESGVDEGMNLIEHLVGLSQTAEYVSTKLIQKLVDDDVPAALLADCIVAWDDTGGDIREVVETILTSDEFLGEDHRLTKVKTPMEYVLSTVRAFEGVVDVGQFEFIITLANLYHLPMYWPTPDGYPEEGPDQLGTSKILERLLFNQTLFEPDFFEQIEFPNIKDIMLDRDVNLSDVEEVTEFWMNRVLGSYDEIDQELAEEFLGTNDSGADWTLSGGANSYEERVLKFLAFLCGYPQHMKQ